MFEVWLSTKHDVYGVTDGELWGGWQLVEFLAEIGFDGESPLDLHALLPRIGAEPSWFTPDELAALEGAEVLVSDPSDSATRPVTIDRRPDTMYEMELRFRDGTSDIAVGPIEKLFTLCKLLRDEDAVPAVYRDRDGLSRIVTPWSLVDIGTLGIGRVEREEDGHDRDAA